MGGVAADRWESGAARMPRRAAGSKPRLDRTPVGPGDLRRPACIVNNASVEYVASLTLRRHGPYHRITYTGRLQLDQGLRSEVELRT